MLNTKKIISTFLISELQMFIDSLFRIIRFAILTICFCRNYAVYILLKTISNFKSYMNLNNDQASTFLFNPNKKKNVNDKPIYIINAPTVNTINKKSKLILLSSSRIPGLSSN